MTDWTTIWLTADLESTWRPEVRRAEIRGQRPTAERDSWGGGSEPTPHHLRGLVEHCISSPSTSVWQEMHFGRTKSPENVSSGCKCRFIVVNKRVLNHEHNFQDAEKRSYSSWRCTCTRCTLCLRHCWDHCYSFPERFTVVMIRPMIFDTWTQTTNFQPIWVDCDEWTLWRLDHVTSWLLFGQTGC